jgi:hypothetical protein
LGFSGYGFSVDDDTADVGAGGASELQLTVIGTGGLKNTNPWTIQAPYGPVKNVSLAYSGQASATNGDTLYNAIASVSNTKLLPIRITTPGEHHLANGDTVRIDQVTGDNAANGTFKIGNVSRTTFDLFDAVTGKTPILPSGTYTGGGRWSFPLHPYIDSGADLTKVFYRVTGDDALGTFQGTFVSVNGVDVNTKDGKKFRVWQLGLQNVGRLLLDADLTDAYGTPLPAGTYNFTFFGVAETGTAPGSAPPPDLAANQSDIQQEIRQDRNALNGLAKIHVPREASIRRWLQVEIAVLQARLAYPTDEVLEQLDQMLDTRTSLSRGAKRRILGQLHARLAELQPGGN